MKLKLYTYKHLEEYILMNNPHSSIIHNNIIDKVINVMDESGVFSLDSEKYTDSNKLLNCIYRENDKTEWWFELINIANKRYWSNHALKLPGNPNWRKCMEEVGNAEKQFFDCCKNNKLYSNDRVIQSILEELILHMSEIISVNNNSERDLIKTYKNAL